MKKLGTLLLSMVLAASILAGCTSNIPKDKTSSAAPSGSAAPSDAASGETAAGGLKTGFAVITSVTDSKDAGAENGLAKTDTTVVAVTVGSDGKIASCVIDGVQTAINFTKEGKLATDLKLEPKTKKELGSDYGLGKASGIGKEWNEQADAFAAYVVGKTLEEVKGIAVKEGAPADADLASSVTIYVGGFIGAVEKAVNSAQDLGAKPGDKLGLGIVTNIASSTEAGEKPGLAQAYSTYAAATFGADGKITSCIIDGSQSNVNFDTAGVIATDLKAEQKTKNELGEAYGMKSASSIGKEWNEEAAAYAAYVTGKTAAEVKGIAVTEKGAPADAELAASVTLGIGSFNMVVEKAAATAK